MSQSDYFSRFTLQEWTADGTTVRVGTNGRIIAETGPHHTPLSEYPQGLHSEDLAHAKFIAAGPRIYAAALAVLKAADGASEADFEEAISNLERAIK